VLGKAEHFISNSCGISKKPNGVRNTHTHANTHTHTWIHMLYYGYFVKSFSVFQVEKTSMPTDFIKPSKCN